MGQRYSKLPSELFTSADTFDLMVMEVALKYSKHINDKANGKIDSSMYDEEELLERLEKARNG